MSTTRWPRSWNSRSFCRTTVWPRWMSGAVGSSPSLTRRGRPSRAAVASLASRAPAGRLSTALRARKAASEAGSAIWPNAILGPSRPGLAAVARSAVPRRLRRLANERRRASKHHSAAAVRLGSAAAQAEGQEASADPDRARSRRPRPGLDGVRDDDGGRLRPAPARERATLPTRPQLDAPGRPRPLARARGLQPEPRPRRLRPDLTGDAPRDHLDRGPPLLYEQRRRHPRYRPRVRPGRSPQGQRAGWLDNHPAVRQERARGPGQPHGVPEIARGGA